MRPGSDGDGEGQLRVHFLPLSVDGRIGFTLLPGRRGRDPEGRFWTRDLEEDLERMTRVVGADVLLLLTEPDELAASRVPGLVAAAQSRGLEVVERPLSPEAPPDDPRAVAPLLERISAEITAGRTVVLVCGDGLGRAPMIAACFLVGEGWSADRALGVIRKLRGPDCLPPGPRADFVAAFADRSSAHRAPPSRPAWPAPEPKVEPNDERLASSPGPATSRRDAGSAVRTVGGAQVAALYGGVAELDPVEPGAAVAEAAEVVEQLDLARAAPEADVHPRTTLSPVESACVGALLGAALGDALGAPLEAIRDRATLVARFGPEGPRAPRLASPPGGGPPLALASDDGQLLELAVETLIEATQRRWELGSTLDRLAERIGRWAEQPRGGHRDPEPSSLESARRLADGVPWAEAGSNGTAGTSHLARAVAFGVAFGQDLRKTERWAGAQSRLTHRAPESVACGAALGVGVARLARGEPVVEALSEMVAAACRLSPRVAARLARALHDADAGVPTEVALDRWTEPTATDALSTAVFVVRRHPEDLEGALREAVTTPGDSDAAGVCVGGLLGARLGAAALPPGWLAVLERRAEREALALALAAANR